MNWQRRSLALGLAACLLLGALPGGASGAKKIRAVVFNVLYLAPLYVAKENGFFAKEGLDVEMNSMKAGQLATTALMAEEAEVSPSSDLREYVLAGQKGKNLIRIYSVAKRMTMDLIVRKEVVAQKKLSRDMPLMERFKALKGMRIGITVPGAATDVISRYYLEKAGLNPDRDAQLMPMGGASLAPALRAGRIDAYMLSPPSPIWLERDGHGTIVIKSSAGDVPEFREWEYHGITVRKEWLQGNEDTARALIRAMNAANNAWRGNMRMAVDASQKYFTRVPRDIVQLSIESLKDSLSPDGVVKKIAVQQFFDLLQRSEPKKFPKSVLDVREGVYYTNKYNPNYRGDAS
ncbi:MAG: ABC transporter substrate-binding protein [Candidatus Tectomicrobia bacterium]|nr:ABC transporter substrate-binding protein [Candidatus Tectomicrobia bacterium]